MPADVSLQFREIDAADVPALFYVRTRTRENTYTLDQLHALGITAESVAERLATSCKGWLCTHAGLVVGFCMADRSTGELWVIAVLPEYEGQGIGNTLNELGRRVALGAGLVTSMAHDGHRHRASRLWLLSPARLDRLESR